MNHLRACSLQQQVGNGGASVEDKEDEEELLDNDDDDDDTKLLLLSFSGWCKGTVFAAALVCMQGSVTSLGEARWIYGVADRWMIVGWVEGWMIVYSKDKSIVTVPWPGDDGHCCVFCVLYRVVSSKKDVNFL